MRREVGECGITDLVVGGVGRADSLRRGAVLCQHVGDTRRGRGDLVAQCSCRHGTVAEHHGGFHPVAQAKPYGLGEEPARRECLLARVLEARENDEADRALLRSQSCDRGVRAAQQVPIGLVRREGGELVDQHDHRGTLNCRRVLTRDPSQLPRALLHLFDSRLEQRHGARGIVGESSEQIPPHRQLHAALAIDSPDLDEPGMNRLHEAEEQSPNQRRLAASGGARDESVRAKRQAPLKAAVRHPDQH